MYLYLIIFTIILLFIIMIIKQLKKKKKLYAELYNLVSNSCSNNIVTLGEGINEPINADNKTEIIKRNIETIMFSNKWLFLMLSENNSPVILSNIGVVVRKYRNTINITEDQEIVFFAKIYDCIRYPNIGLIRLTRELNAI